ncbi:MAG: NYN domain-containing protein [Anaerolineales bacterium]
MPYLIDGHNLIPKLGLSLNSPDDEMELLTRLNEFARLSRKPGLEVYFDGAPPLQAGSRQIGLIQAHFVRQGKIADDAIRDRLLALGKRAKNWVVVSSDRMVQANARAAHAALLSSEEFAAQVQATLRAGPPAAEKASSMSESELATWLALFGGEPPKPGKL